MSRILIISPAWPLRGGIASFSEILARELNQQGHHTHIISFSLQYPAFLFPGKTQVTNDPQPRDLSIAPLINSIWPPSWSSAAKAANAFSPDVVIIRFWLPFFAPCLGTIARRIKKKNPSCRIIAIADNAIPHEKRPGDALLARYFFSRVDEVVTMSSSVADDIKKLKVNAPVRVTFHPVYNRYGERTERMKARKFLGVPPDASVILFFGFIRKYKGLELLLRALAANEWEERKPILLVAGEFYDDRKPYEDLVEQLGIKNQVKFFSDFIPDDQVSLFFSAANVLAQPYLSATQSGITQIAFHFGLPMVVTAVGGLPEIVDDGVNGFVCQTSPDSLARALVRFFNEKHEAAFSQEVLKKAGLFSWENFIRVVLLNHKHENHQLL